MITETNWRRLLYVATGLVIMVILVIIFFVIPQVNPITQPQATGAFWIVISIQLFPVAALIYTIIFSHREGHYENGFLVSAGVVLLLLGLILTDAASEIFLYTCIGSDFIAAVLSFIARYFRGHLLSEK